MVLSVHSVNSPNFCANDKARKEYSRDTLLKNNPSTQLRIGVDKLTNAMTIYPAKGLKGSKNSNFYEFLTLGTVPYLIGSAAMIAVFNAANKFYPAFERSEASKIGRRMALGVVFYGLFKSISKAFITKPVAALTGVDTELPYARINHMLPEHKNDTDVTSIEYHKVYESIEFPRWDLLYGDETKGQKINGYYDRVASKLGYGENLVDSDQEVKPRIKEIVAKSSAAKNISSYLWAATGVAVAFQEPWKEFLKDGTLKFWRGKDFLKSCKIFGRNFKDSFKSLVRGEGNGAGKYAGKVLFFAALASSILGVANAVTHTPRRRELIAMGQNEKWMVD